MASIKTEISERELREIYKMFSKEILIDHLIGKNTECQILSERLLTTIGQQYLTPNEL